MRESVDTRDALALADSLNHAGLGEGYVTQPALDHPRCSPVDRFTAGLTEYGVRLGSGLIEYPGDDRDLAGVAVRDGSTQSIHAHRVLHDIASGDPFRIGAIGPGQAYGCRFLNRLKLEDSTG
jgi:hypothetical protein